MVLKHVNDCEIFKLFGSAYSLTMLQGIILIDTLSKGIFVPRHQNQFGREKNLQHSNFI